MIAFTRISSRMDTAKSFPPLHAFTPLFHVSTINLLSQVILSSANNSFGHVLLSFWIIWQKHIISKTTCIYHSVFSFPHITWRFGEMQIFFVIWVYYPQNTVRPTPAPRATWQTMVAVDSLRLEAEGQYFCKGKSKEWRLHSWFYLVNLKLEKSSNQISEITFPYFFQRKIENTFRKRMKQVPCPISNS